MDHPLISVIIVNFNTRDLLRACLRSVTADNNGVEAEIIVIDNGSSDDSIAMVRHDFPSVVLQQNSWNQRFAKPNNDGMRIARGEFLFFLNSDAVITRGTLASLAGFLKAHSDAGACGPRLEYPDGRLQRSVSKYHSPWTHFCDMLFLDSLFPRTVLFGGGEMMHCPYDESKTQQVESLMGAAFMVRRAVIQNTGMFDEELTVFYNEMDWFRRMKKNGWAVYYAPVATVVHHRGVTSENMNRDFGYLDEMYYNVFYYFHKHYGFTGLVFYRFWLMVGFLLRRILWGARSMFQNSGVRSSHVEYVRRVLKIALRFWIPFRQYRPSMSGAEKGS